MKDYLRVLVLESTGLEQTLEAIEQKYNQSKQVLLDEKARAEVNLEELVEKAKEEQKVEIDSMVGEQEIFDEDYDFEEFE